MALFHGKKFRTLLLTSFFCVGFSGVSQALEVGNKAPDFELSGQQGNVKLSSTAGSVVYVDFWASWCGPCKKSFGWMNEMQEKYKAQGFKIIAINLDDKSEDAKKFLLQNPAKFTVAFDPKKEFATVYGVKGMPTSFLIGKNGKIINQHLGFSAADSGNLEKQIKTAVEAKK
jgi:cytochrome c biogenesis protein CcmG/thiol:disulfide interchange protein DsbE